MNEPVWTLDLDDEVEGVKFDSAFEVYTFVKKTIRRDRQVTICRGEGLVFNGTAARYCFLYESGHGR